MSLYLKHLNSMIAHLQLHHILEQTSKEVNRVTHSTRIQILPATQMYIAPRGFMCQQRYADTHGTFKQGCTGRQFRFNDQANGTLEFLCVVWRTTREVKGRRRSGAIADGLGRPSQKNLLSAALRACLPVRLGAT